METQTEKERYDLKAEQKILNKFLRLFKEVKDVTSLYTEDEILQKETVSFYDPAIVCLCIANTNKAKLLLRRFVDKEAKEFKLNSLDYQREPKNISQGMYSIEYLKLILDIFKAMDENPILTMSNDYPLKLEMEKGDYIFILAPRMRYD